MESNHNNPIFRRTYKPGLAIATWSNTEEDGSVTLHTQLSRRKNKDGEYQTMDFWDLGAVVLAENALRAAREFLERRAPKASKPQPSGNRAGQRLERRIVGRHTGYGKETL